MADSAVQICNKALLFIGEDFITDLAGPEKEARHCNIEYPFSRRALIREHMWRFSIARAQVAASGTSPLFGFDNAFDVPSGWVRTALVNDGDKEWREEGNQILANLTAPINLIYAQDITDTTKFDPLFDEALAARIAFNLAEPLAQSNTVKQAAAAWLDDVRNRAMMIDSLSDWPDDPIETSFVTVRV